MTRKAAAGVLLLAVAACGGDGVAETVTIAPTTAPTVVVADPLVGFEQRQIGISGETWTVVVAATPAERAQGLMGVTDLGDRDGMLFVFEGDTDSGFWMKHTLIPLDIAFFAADGSLVDLLTMAPCEQDPCPVYLPGGSYRYAIETVQGRWDGIAEPSLEVTSD